MYILISTKRDSRRREVGAWIMALRADKMEDRRDTASIAAQARELFGEWAAEEEVGYRGEVSWEEFKRDLNAGRPPHNKPFQKSP